MGGENGISQGTLWRQQGPHFSSHSTAKTNDKTTFLGRLVFNGISDVVITLVYFEKICLKKLIMMMKIIIIITEKPFTSK